jgi:hypothetical protein
MRQTISVTEQDLRGAMGEERYWRPGHPERAAFTAWVSGGFRGLYPADGPARGAVWVRPYVRDGHRVSGHWRSPPEGGGSPRGADDHRSWDGDDDEAEFIPASLSRLLRRGVRRAPADSDRGGTGPLRGRGRNPRRPDVDGRDRVDDLRADTETRRERNLADRADQWSRPGGEEARARDLERLGPVGPPEDLGSGVMRYTLQDKRTAVLRPSTSPGSDGLPTLEIAEPTTRPDRYRTTDKFRYPSRR